MPPDQSIRPQPDSAIELQLELLAERDARVCAEVRAKEATRRADRLGADLAAVVADRAARTVRLQAELDSLRLELLALQQELADVRVSRWWRLAIAYRELRQLVGSHRG
jgi:hypothetical protein